MAVEDCLIRRQVAYFYNSDTNYDNQDYDLYKLYMPQGGLTMVRSQGLKLAGLLLKTTAICCTRLFDEPCRVRSIILNRHRSVVGAV